MSHPEFKYMSLASGTCFYRKFRTNHVFLSLFLLGCLASHTLFSQQNISQLSTQAPNVILILADDLGYGDVSAYNEQAAFQTTHIDRLAASGISFTDAHTSAAICTPTRYGILTGRYNWRSPLKSGGFNGYSSPLIDPDRTTIAKLFKENGYQTAMIGKWHLGWDWHYIGKKEDRHIDFSQAIQGGPTDHGFDYFYGLCASLSSPPFVYVENRQPTSIPYDTSVNYDEKAFWRKGPKAEDFSHADVLTNLTEKTVDYIHQQADKETPFFLYCALTAPHAPIIPTTEFIGKSNTNAYGDFVLMVDHMIGQIMDAVTAQETLENTLVIFTSDNGQSPRADFEDDELPLAGHNGSYIFRGKKFDIFEGGHRVPFIVKWPNHVEAGTQSDETICTVDLMATIADVLEVELDDNTGEDSYSILPVLQQQDYHNPLREATVHHSSDGRFAIRKEEWKLILWPGSGGWAYPKTEEDMKGLPRFQLYNLALDPSEQVNLISEHPEKVKELKSLLESYVKNGRSTPGSQQQNDGPVHWAELEWMESTHTQTDNK